MTPRLSSPDLSRRDFIVAGAAMVGAICGCSKGKNHSHSTELQLSAYQKHERQLLAFLKNLEQGRVMLERFFADANIELTCMDEGDEPDINDDSVVKFGMAGTGAKAKPEELTEFAGRARRERAFQKRLWKIIYHEACAAHEGNLEEAMAMAIRLAELLGLPKDVVHRDGFSEEADRKMTRDPAFHGTRTITMDSTARFQEHKLPFHTLDISSRHVPPPYLRRQLKLGGEIIEGDHGFGPVFKAEDKIVLMTIAETPKRIDDLLSETEKDGWGTFKHPVQHIPILMPR